MKTSTFFICLVFLFSAYTSSSLLLNRLKAITKLFKIPSNHGKDVLSSLKQTTSKLSTFPQFPIISQDKVGFSTIEEITDKNYEDVLLQTNGLKAVLFTAKWAAPCKAMSSNFVKASLPTHQLTDTRFYEIDIDSNPISTAAFNVRSVPSVVIFDDSKIVAEIVGTVPAQVISDYLNKNYGEPFQ